MEQASNPSVRFQHIGETPFAEVKSQQHRDRKVSVWLRMLVDRDDRALFHTRYDPGLVLERHGHASDHYVFVISGDVMFGDERCGPGSLVELPLGATFGPIVVGPEGAELVEVYFGNTRPIPADPDEYLRLLADKGIERLPPPAVPGRAPGERYDT